MRYNNMLPFRAALATAPLFLGFASAQASSGLTQEYCSSENTGSDYSAVYNIYQSNGACYTQCLDNYAFAVVQYQNCWCTNYIPADQQDTGSCSQKCPGYPSDLCGDKNSGLYGYIKLRNQPSGTAGAASSSSTPVSTSTSKVERSSTSDMRSLSTSRTTFASSTTPVVPSSASSRSFEPSSLFQTSSTPLLTSSSPQTSSSSEEPTSSSVLPQTSSVSPQTTTSSSTSSTTESSVTPV